MNIFQRKDGRYQANVYIGVVNGKKKTKSLTGKSYGEVKQKLINLQYDVEHDLYVEPSKATLCDTIRQFLKSHKIKAELEETTCVLYDYYLDKIFVPYFGNLLLQTVRPFHIENFYIDLMSKGISANTCQKYHTILNQTFKFAYKNDMIKSNVMTKVDRPQIKKKFTPTICTPDDFKRLIDYTKGTTMGLIILIAATVGMRRSEIFALKWADIDFENNKITIDKAIVKGIDNKYYEKDTKNLVTATLSVPKFLIDEFTNYKSTKKVIDINGDSLIFDEFSADNCTSRFMYIRDKLGLKIRFHDLRHFNATIMLKSGVSDKEAAARLRHKNVSTTREIYQHVLDEMDTNTANIIGNEIKRAIK